MVNSLNSKLNSLNHECRNAPPQDLTRSSVNKVTNHGPVHRYMHTNDFPRLSFLLGPHLHHRAPYSNGHHGLPALHLYLCISVSVSLSVSLSPTLVMKHSTKSHAVPQRGHCISHRPLCFELHLLFIGEGLQRSSSASRSITYMTISLTSFSLCLSLSLCRLCSITCGILQKQFLLKLDFSAFHNPHSFHFLRGHCSALIVNF